MRSEKSKKIRNIIAFTISIVLSWGGILYFTNSSADFKFIGIIVSLIGYGLFFWAALNCEENYSKESICKVSKENHEK